MCCLARLLPLMVEEKIEEGNRHWENFLLHLSIVDYTFVPVISDGMVAYIREMIHDHHLAFKELIHHAQLIPRCTIWYTIHNGCLSKYLLLPYGTLYSD